MGNCNECAETSVYEFEPETEDEVEFDKIELLGVGSFARVWKIKLKFYENSHTESLRQEYFNKLLALKEFKYWWNALLK